uniref:Laccase family protein n=1 Tax=Populus alba TaxID=43335 RepID=A0A4U5QR35_POPAL|nr:laccase family protein [Populus alba]
MEHSNWVIRFMLLAVFLLPALVECRIRHYKFNVVMKNTTRLCSRKPIVTVNGRFPGPTLYAREDDTVLVKVVNHVKYNVSIHWHGIRSTVRTGWAEWTSQYNYTMPHPARAKLCLQLHQSLVRGAHFLGTHIFSGRAHSSWCPGCLA